MDTQEENPKLQIAADTMAGDLRDVMLSFVRTMDVPWSELPENQQARIIEAIEAACRDTVREAVNVIVGHGFKTVMVTIGAFGVKDGVISGKFNAPATVGSMGLLVEQADKTAVIAMCDYASYMGEKAPTPVDPDQPGLALAGQVDPNLVSEVTEAELAQGDQVMAESGIAAIAPKPGPDEVSEIVDDGPRGVDDGPEPDPDREHDAVANGDKEPGPKTGGRRKYKPAAAGDAHIADQIAKQGTNPDMPATPPAP